MRALSPLESRWTRVGRFGVHYRAPAASARDSLPLIGIHGLGVSTRYLLPSLERLARDRPVYAPDLPGFGRSERPAHTLDVFDHARFVLTWMDRIGVERAVLFANSMGCQVAVEAAIAEPERAACLILVGPTADPAAPTLSRHFARLALDATREPAKLNWVVTTDYLRAGPRRTFVTARHMLRHRAEERLPLVQAPTLVIRGERDVIVPQAWAAEAASLVPRGRLAVVAAAAHCAHFGWADAVVRLTSAFIAEHGD